MLMDNATFVESLKDTSVVREYQQAHSAIDDKVWSAMKRVDRKDFLPEAIYKSSQSFEPSVFIAFLIAHLNPKEKAYFDEPVIFYSNGDAVQTCSQPSIVAVMADAL